MRTTKMTIINLESGDQLKVWLNGVEMYLRAGDDPVIAIKRHRGLRVLPSHFESTPGQEVPSTFGDMVFDQVDVVPIDKSH